MRSFSSIPKPLWEGVSFDLGNIEQNQAHCDIKRGIILDGQ